MGFSSTSKMREGLRSVKALLHNTIGTITVDSKTRLCLFDEVERALEEGRELNGYPIVTIGAEKTHEMVSSLQDGNFPIQVRHGSPLPYEIFKATSLSGIDALEGGPASYCLPYSRIPLSDCVEAWRKCCEFWAETGDKFSKLNHLESFGGCMMGQLCPPGMLSAITILEGLFFIRCGLKSISISHLQGTNFDQDIGGIIALKKLGNDFLTEVKWHTVLYTFMGLFPKTLTGARRIIEDSSKIAKIAGVERLIVKTAAEAHQIPTINDNLKAMSWVFDTVLRMQHHTPSVNAINQSKQIYKEAKKIIEAVLNLHSDIGAAMLLGFRKGILDIPFCLHPDNQNKARPFLDRKGVIGWSSTGNVPIERSRNRKIFEKVDSSGFLNMLSFNQLKYDAEINYEL